MTKNSKPSEDSTADNSVSSEGNNSPDPSPSEKDQVNNGKSAQAVTAEAAANAAMASSLPPYMIPPNMGQSTIIAAQHHQQAWNAPVPPPEAAERFEKICPGSFERMLRMAEREQENQIELSQKQLEVATYISHEQVNLARRAQDLLAQDTKRGHWLGAGISVLAMIGGMIAIFYQQPYIGVAFLSLPIATIVIAFVKSNAISKPAPSQKSPSPAADTKQIPQEKNTSA